MDCQERVLVENNTFAKTLTDAQAGFVMNIKSTDQDGGAPWSNTSNVTIRNNVITDAPSGIAVSANPEGNAAVATSNIAITGNTFRNIGGTAGTPSGSLFLLTGYGGPLKNVTIANNTATQGDGRLANTVSFDGTPTQGLTFTGNVLTQGASGSKGSGAGEGAATLAAFAPGAVFSGNTLLGGNPGNYNGLGNGNTVKSGTDGP